MTKTPAGTRIFITGGASGLGRALAERYARAGWRVCIGDLDVARCADALAAITAAGGVGHALACGVTRDEDFESAAAWLKENWGGVDVVVNNAGVAQAGLIADVPLQDWRWIIDINLLGVVRGCRVFTPMFRDQGHGRFINVSSIAGLLHMPGMASYNATKAAVVALSETLHLELERDHIGVTVVCPAFFRTNLASTMRATDPRLEALTRKLVGSSRHSAEWIADLVYRGAERGDFFVVTHRDSLVAWMLKRLLPHRAFTALARREAARFLGKTA